MCSLARETRSHPLQSSILSSLVLASPSLLGVQVPSACKPHLRAWTEVRSPSVNLDPAHQQSDLLQSPETLTPCFLTCKMKVLTGSLADAWSGQQRTKDCIWRGSPHSSVTASLVTKAIATAPLVTVKKTERAAGHRLQRPSASRNKFC